ncbi:hypothetical protein [Metabacillus fastidiosus]|uniref:hypothetical protein n=1 Tax=Metabacillus fastidiosus TaxID=1458 RepID=UPI003D2A58F8
MKFLVSEENWDIQGYGEYLKTIAHRFDEQTSEFILHKSFHDGDIKYIKLINHFDRSSEEEIKDPTSIRMIIEHSGGSLYEIVWSEVRRFFFDYDITRNVYSNLNEIVWDGMCGIDEWGYDEILETSNQMISHEIDLFSKTKIIIICRGIQINQLES